MITITVTGAAGSLVAVPSAYSVPFPGYLQNNTIDNQTQDLIWICQVSLVSDVAALASGPIPPAYVCYGACQPNAQQSVSVGPSNNKVYVGFVTGAAAPDTSAMQALFANALASNDAWFLKPPASSPIAPLHSTGCVDVSLTAQTDPNPPHNVHPKMHVKMNSWNGNNALMWVTNDSGRDVTFYVEIFHRAFGEPQPQPPTFLAWGLPARLNSWVFPFGQGGSMNLKAWYGFAFTGQYATPQAYFAAHPYDPDGGHHTGQIPPTTT